MIEIKCDELQKQATIEAIIRSESCIIEIADEKCRLYNCCADCLNENIKWIISKE